MQRNRSVRVSEDEAIPGGRLASGAGQEEDVTRKVRPWVRFLFLCRRATFGRYGRRTTIYGSRSPSNSGSSPTRNCAILSNLFDPSTGIVSVVNHSNRESLIGLYGKPRVIDGQRARQSLQDAIAGSASSVFPFRA